MESKRISDFVEEFQQLGEERFAKRHDNPILLRREDDAGEESDVAFHTAFMKREALGDLENPSDEAASPFELERQMERQKHHPVGEVLPIVKRQGAAFQDRIGVGRARNADVCLLLPKVSKYHAYFAKQPEGEDYTLTDAGSKNGTFVDGQQLSAREPIELRDGQEVCFGPYRFNYYSAKGFVGMVARRAAVH